MKLHKGLALYEELRCLTNDLVDMTDKISGYTDKTICKRIAKLRKKLKLKE